MGEGNGIEYGDKVGDGSIVSVTSLNMFVRRPTVKWGWKTVLGWKSFFISEYCQVT